MALTFAATGRDLLRVGADAGQAVVAKRIVDDINTAIAAAISGGGVTVINKTGGTLTKGQPVTIQAFDTTSGLLKVVAADNTNPGKPADAVLAADLLNNGQVTLTPAGDYIVTASGLNTSGGGVTVGDPVYLGATGVLTLAQPTFAGGAAIVQIVGAVKTKAASGELAIFVQAPVSAQALVAVPNTRALTATAPLTFHGDNAAHDLSTDGTFAIPAATNAVNGYSTSAQVTAQEAATTALSKLKTGASAIIAGQTTIAIALGAATWDGKGAQITLTSIANGTGAIAAVPAMFMAVAAGGSLNVTLVDAAAGAATAALSDLAFKYDLNAN